MQRIRLDGLPWHQGKGHALGKRRQKTSRQILRWAKEAAKHGALSKKLYAELELRLSTPETVGEAFREANADHQLHVGAPYASFLHRLRGHSPHVQLGIIDAKMRRLQAEGGRKKKLARLAALREFVSAAARIDGQIGRERTVALAGARRKGYAPGFRF